jgi:hypothetical protein
MYNHSEFDPIVFNALKHHAGFIREFIKVTSIRDLPHRFNRIGNAQFDLYFGSLSVSTVIDEVRDQIDQTVGLEREMYNQWMLRGRGYQKVELSDASQWILRVGDDKERFVHLHPGRYSPFTIRVSSNTLKTVIAVTVWMTGNHNHALDPDTINQVRCQLLGLSPLHHIPPGGSLDRIFSILFGRANEL